MDYITFETSDLCIEESTRRQSEKYRLGRVRIDNSSTLEVNGQYQFRYNKREKKKQDPAQEDLTYNYYRAKDE